MTVRLRAHHLLCLLTYVGKGYTSAFVAGCDAIAARLARGEMVEVVEGPDDMCAPLVRETGPRDGDDPHCHAASAAARDALAARDVAGLIGRPVAAGSILALDRATLARLRAAIAAGDMAAACAGCPWQDLCRQVAATGFDGARIAPRAHINLD